MFKKVILNTGAQVVGKAITASITLLITVIIGKNLGPAGYGEFTKIFVFVGYFYTLADFGLNSIYIKIAKEGEITHLRPLFGLRLIIGISLAVIAVIISRFFPFDPITSTGFSPLVKTGIAIAAITIITQALFTTTNAFFQKILRYDLSTISTTLGYLAILTTATVITSTSKSLLGYTSAYVIGNVILVLAAYLQVANRIKKFFAPSFNMQEFSTFLKPAWPVGIALLFNLIYFRIDVLILSNFRSSTEVGLYGLAYQFFEAALAIPIFFSNAIYPPLANFYSQKSSAYSQKSSAYSQKSSAYSQKSSAYKENKERFQKEVKNWLFILTGISILLSLTVFVISFFIPRVFGVSFVGSVPSLQILSLGFPFFFISALLWHLLIIFDKQKYLTIIYAIGAVINVAANLIFIPSYGYIAASVITVVSEALITLLLAIAIHYNNLKIKSLEIQ